MPPTPREARYLLFAKIDKDALLRATPSPRIIFIGGSNLSFGMNSQIIKDSLHLNPINTSLHAKLGLLYMMDSTITYVKSGDIVVIAPEYSQFYGNFAYGGEELLKTILGVSPESITHVNTLQWLNISSYLPKYAFSKFKRSNYLPKREKEIGIYERKSFNKYGDVDTYWNLDGTQFSEYGPIGGNFNYRILEHLVNFRTQLQNKGATLYITFPCFQEKSYNNSATQIVNIEKELRNNGFTLLGTPERYKMPEHLMYNSPYHLTKEGVDIRTHLLINDLIEAFNSNPG